MDDDELAARLRAVLPVADVEDALQETFLAAWRGAGGYQPQQACGGCAQTAIPVCVNPAHPAYLPAVRATLGRELSELAGLPGAPGRVDQGAQAFQQGPGNSINRVPNLRPASGSAEFFLPDPLPGEQGQTSAAFDAQLEVTTGLSLVAGVVGTASRSPAAAAAARFAALPAATQHAWLDAHLPALRAGRISLAQLP